MHYNTHGLLSVLFFIHVKFTTQAELCHQFPSKINPEVLCNGFANLLHFNKLPGDQVYKLSFSKNKITTITSSSFDDTLPSVTEIYLDNNTITNISANAFKNLPNIQTIDLSNNALEVLQLEMFSSNKELTTIDLAGNNIRILHTKLINRLSKLQTLILSKNPLEVCNPTTAETLRYLEEKKIDTLFLATCENPSLYQEPKPEETRTRNVTPESDNAVTKNYDLIDKLLPLVVFGMVLLMIIGLGCVIGNFCLKVHNTNYPDYGRTRTVSGNYLLSKGTQRFSIISGKDENGYMRPRNPLNTYKYLAVLRDANEPPLIGLNSEADLSRVRICVDSPGPYATPQDDEVTYELSHVYEEIQEPRNFYEENIQSHLEQPYYSYV